MLTLTPSAIAAVSMVLQQPQVPNGAGLRFQGGVDPDGDPVLGIAVISAPAPGDELVAVAIPGSVFVAQDVAQVLDACVLDAEIEGQSVAFTIHPQPLNGNAPH